MPRYMGQTNFVSKYIPEIFVGVSQGAIGGDLDNTAFNLKNMYGGTSLGDLNIFNEYPKHEARVFKMEPEEYYIGIDINRIEEINELYARDEKKAGEEILNYIAQKLVSRLGLLRERNLAAKVTDAELYGSTNTVDLTAKPISTWTEADIDNFFSSFIDLAKYLIYGTMEEQDQYVVQLGDTIADVSFNNRISTEEFLIANTNFKTANDLLFPGQVVTLGILQPQVKVIEESHVVERQTVNYETEYINDDTQYVGYESVRQEGSNGVNLVTQKIRKQNGQILSVVVTNTIEEVPSVKRIVVRGTKLKQSYSSSTINDNVVVPVELGSWGWPTRQGYTLSSRYGYRWGKLHAAIDISGTGEGSPIYAANNGIVVFAGWRSGGSGYTVWIKHANGYYSEYAHMQRVTVSAGTIVYTGDVIGAMGHTGNAQGTHLHFGMWYGYPFRSSSFNPCNVLGC